MTGVIPSARFLRLLALGLVPAVLGVWMPGMFLVALVYAAGLGALLVAGGLVSGRVVDLEVSRRVADRLSVGEEEPVELVIRNYSSAPGGIELLDTPPRELAAAGLPLRLEIGPREEATVTYRVTPNARGRHEFGDLYLRFTPRPGLLQRQLRIPAAREVRVYPDMREVTRYELMARRSRLDELGIHRSRLAGRGTEFERIRDYTPDDEYRSVDWKATARRGKPMARVYQVEKSQNVFIVLDAGRMMAGRAGKLSRLDYAVNAALMLAHVALRAGDRVGLMVVSDAVDAYLPLGKSAGQFRQCLDLLYGVEARLVHVDYRGALEQIAHRCKRRSLVVFFTDLVDEETSSELVTYLRLLRPVHLPLCVTLQDQHLVDTSRQACETAGGMYRRAVALELLAERRRVLESLQKLGAVICDSPPEELSVQVLNRYLELKSRQRL